MAEMTARETYYFHGDKIWVDHVTATFPNKVEFTVSVPVPNPNLSDEAKGKIESYIKKNLNNAIVRIGRQAGGKGKPIIRTTRVLQDGRDVEIEHEQRRNIGTYNA